MRRRQATLHPFTGFFTVLAVLVAFVGLSLPARPAQAADAETTRLSALIDGLTTFLPSTAGVGALGQAVPSLDVAPGSDAGVGLSDLMQKTRDEVMNIATAATIDDLVSGIN